jgi:hypothetical protein
MLVQYCVLLPLLVADDEERRSAPAISFRNRKMFFFSLQDNSSNMPELKLKHTIQIQTGLKCVAMLGRTLRDVAVFKVKSGRGLLTHLTG